jgi:hypothetical protein
MWRIRLQAASLCYFLTFLLIPISVLRLYYCNRIYFARSLFARRCFKTSREL